MKKVYLLGMLVALTLLGCKESSKNEKQEKTQTEEADSHTAENSLDWNGTYKGFLPCADCPGILITVTLNNDKTFTKTDLYLESKEGTFEDKGTFSFSKCGNKIILESSKESVMYAVGENKLILLDKEGKEVTSEFAKMYELRKLSDEEVEFTDAPVKGFLTFGHEVSCFRPCGSSKVYWITDFPNGKLTKQYKKKMGKNAAPYTPVLAELVVKYEGKAKDGFPEQYDGVLKTIKIKSVTLITSENYCEK